jgi:nucleoside-diphosphate-sugar epimerase
MLFGCRFLLLLLAIFSSYTVAEETVAEEEDDTSHECEGRLVLVTGGSGHTGTLATQLLLKRGFCVRVFTRNEQKARKKLDLILNDYESQYHIEFAEGELGDGVSVQKEAFRPRAESGKVSVSHVVFAAGGEQADFDAVNHRGVAECALEAVRVGATSMVVISAAWVTKPYSVASLLFNSVYPSLPMALHLQGEDTLRQASSADPAFNYVIIRAGRLVGDEEYPEDGPKGLTLAQGDSFSFFGPAGLPGMCHTQLAHAVVTALQVKGKYTVEMTSGEMDADDSNSAYQELVQDGSVRTTSDTDIARLHARAVSDLYNALLTLGVGGILLVIGIGWKRGIPMALTLYLVCLYLWSIWYSDRSVEDCLASE